MEEGRGKREGDLQERGEGREKRISVLRDLYVLKESLEMKVLWIVLGKGNGI